MMGGSKDEKKMVGSDGDCRFCQCCSDDSLRCFGRLGFCICECGVSDRE